MVQDPVAYKNPYRLTSIGFITEPLTRILLFITKPLELVIPFQTRMYIVVAGVYSFLFGIGGAVVYGGNLLLRVVSPGYHTVVEQYTQSVYVVAEPYIGTPVFYGVLLFIFYMLFILQNVPFTTPMTGMEGREASRLPSTHVIFCISIGLISGLYAVVGWRWLLYGIVLCTFLLTEMVRRSMKADLESRAVSYYPVEWRLISIRGLFFAGAATIVTGGDTYGLVFLAGAIGSVFVHNWKRARLFNSDTKREMSDYYASTGKTLLDATDTNEQSGSGRHSHAREKYNPEASVTADEIRSRLTRLEEAADESNEILLDEIKHRWMEFEDEATRYLDDEQDWYALDEDIEDYSLPQLVHLRSKLKGLGEEGELPPQVEQSHNRVMRSIDTAIDEWQTMFDITDKSQLPDKIE